MACSRLQPSGVVFVSQCAAGLFRHLCRCRCCWPQQHAELLPGAIAPLPQTKRPHGCVPRPLPLLGVLIQHAAEGHLPARMAPAAAAAWARSSSDQRTQTACQHWMLRAQPVEQHACMQSVEGAAPPQQCHTQPIALVWPGCAQFIIYGDSTDRQAGRQARMQQTNALSAYHSSPAPSQFVARWVSRSLPAAGLRH